MSACHQVPPLLNEIQSFIFSSLVSCPWSPNLVYRPAYPLREWKKKWPAEYRWKLRMVSIPTRAKSLGGEHNYVCVVSRARSQPNNSALVGFNVVADVDIKQTVLQNKYLMSSSLYISWTEFLKRFLKCLFLGGDDCQTCPWGKFPQANFSSFLFQLCMKGSKCPPHSPEKLSNFTVGQPGSLRFTKNTCQSL